MNDPASSQCSPEDFARHAAQWAEDAHRIFSEAIRSSRQLDDRYPALARGRDILVIPRPYSDEFLANLRTLAVNLSKLQGPAR